MSNVVWVDFTNKRRIEGQIAQVKVTSQVKPKPQSKAKLRAFIEEYLENELCFRDYYIKDSKQYGSINKRASMHLNLEGIDLESIPWYLDNALSDFGRDGYSIIYFYI